MTAERRHPAAAPAGPFAQCQVLVVDDHHGARLMIGRLLQSMGITQVAYANDGVEALERVEQQPPDLVILDIMMPRMDGFDVCRRLRQDSRFQRLPILVQTALGAPEERTDVFRAGATDVVPKPIHGPELIARVRVHLQNAVLLRSLEAYQHRVKEELDVARTMQEDLLPEPEELAALCGRHGLALHSEFQTSSELGGDYWGIDALGDGRIGVFIADFAGHGVTAALNTFRLHTLMSQMEPCRGPADYLALLNTHLARLMRPGQFATLLYGIIDTAANRFTYASAGAPAPILGDAGGARLLESSGLPVGITAAATYEERQAAFPPGSFLLLYSDALVESVDADGAMIEPETLLDWTRDSAAADASPTPPLERLLHRFRDNGRRVDDDLTAVWIERDRKA